MKMKFKVFNHFKQKTTTTTSTTSTRKRKVCLFIRKSIVPNLYTFCPFRFWYNSQKSFLCRQTAGSSVVWMPQREDRCSQMTTKHVKGGKSKEWKGTSGSSSNQDWQKWTEGRKKGERLVRTNTVEANKYKDRGGSCREKCLHQTQREPMIAGTKWVSEWVKVDVVGQREEHHRSIDRFSRCCLALPLLQHHWWMGR